MRRQPFDNIRTEAVYLYVINGGRPERPTGVFSNTLWELLVQSWYEEPKSMPSRRPSISLIHAQLEQEAGAWTSLPRDPGTPGSYTLLLLSNWKPSFAFSTS